MVNPIPKLCLIADCNAIENLLPRAIATINNHPVWIMIRDKNATEQDLQDALNATLKMVYYHPNARLSINGADSLLHNNAYLGLHLPSTLDWQDMRQRHPKCFMGGSLHTAFDIEKAKQATLNYVTISPLFPTQSHPEAHPIDKATLKQILKRLSCQTVALGGINGDTLEHILDYNFDSYACIQGWQDDHSLTKMISILYGS